MIKANVQKCALTTTTTLMTSMTKMNSKNLNIRSTIMNTAMTTHNQLGENRPEASQTAEGEVVSSGVSVALVKKVILQGKKHYKNPLEKVKNKKLMIETDQGSLWETRNSYVWAGRMIYCTKQSSIWPEVRPVYFVLNKKVIKP